MKILVITPWFPQNEDDPYVSYITDSLKALMTLGIEIIVLWVYPWRRKYAVSTEFQQTFKLIECSYLSIPRHYFRFISNWSLIKRVKKKIDELSLIHSFDLIHAHSELYSLPLAKIGFKKKIPSVVTIHGVETNPRYWNNAGKLIGKSLQQVNKVIVVGEPLISFFSEYAQNIKFNVIYNGFCEPKTLQSEKFNNDTIRFISVCNLNDNGKNIDLVLKALWHIEQLGLIKWTYTAIGDGKLRHHLESLCDELELKQKVKFLGACSHEEVYNQLNEADVFCLPSCPEAFGIAHLEAVGHGLLTIACKGQGPSIYIEHLKTGLLVDPLSVHSLVEMMQSIFRDQSLMCKIAKEGKEYVLNRFTWDNHARKLLELYSETISYVNS